MNGNNLLINLKTVFGNKVVVKIDRETFVNLLESKVLIEVLNEVEGAFLVIVENQHYFIESFSHGLLVREAFTLKEEPLSVFNKMKPVIKTLNPEMVYPTKELELKAENARLIKELDKSFGITTNRDVPIIVKNEKEIFVEISLAVKDLLKLTDISIKFTT